MSCPSALDLVRYATGDQDAIDSTIESHVSSCADCTRAVTALRGAAAVFRGADVASAPRTPDCPNDDLIAALCEGSLGADEREKLLPHLSTCSRCRSLLASLSRVRLSAESSRELRALGQPGGAPGRRFRWRGVMIPMAAAAALLLVIWSRGERSPLREPPASGQTPRPIMPVGRVETLHGMVWSRVVRADRYRVTIFDRDGEVVWETQTRDTALSLPPAVHLQDGVHYFWKVAARMGFDRWVESPLAEFTAVRDPPRQ